MAISLPPTRDNTPLAALIITATVLLLTLGDATLKGLSSDLHLWQIFVVRSVLAVPVLLIILRRVAPDVPMLTCVTGWTLLRSLLLVVMWVLYYAALPHLDLSVAAAAYYTLPLFITLFSALFTHEQVGRGGWLAVALGFAGVVLILRPASEAFSLVAMLPLGAAMLYALAMILTRTKCRAAHPLGLSLGLNVTFIVIGGAVSLGMGAMPGLAYMNGFLSPEWVALNIQSGLALGLMALAVLLGSIGTAVAYQIGRSSTVATFDFSYVGFATLWGLLFFAERPDSWTLTGMAMIVGAGILALRGGK